MALKQHSFLGNGRDENDRTPVSRQQIINNATVGPQWKSCVFYVVRAEGLYARRGLELSNIRGLNLAVVKLTTVQVTKLPLYHKIRKLDICFAKPVLT
jgi:hypothetical protein